MLSNKLYSLTFFPQMFGGVTSWGVNLTFLIVHQLVFFKGSDKLLLL